MEVLSEIFKMLLARKKLLSKKHTLTTRIYNHPKSTVLAWLVILSPMLLADNIGIGLRIVWFLGLAFCLSQLSLLYTYINANGEGHEVIPMFLLQAWHEQLAAEHITATWREQEVALLRTVHTWDPPGLRKPAEVLQPAIAALRAIVAARS